VLTRDEARRINVARLPELLGDEVATPDDSIEASALTSDGSVELLIEAPREMGVRKSRGRKATPKSLYPRGDRFISSLARKSVTAAKN
jgi:hypothetical protein